MKLSIIIPIYNAEKTLIRCVDSVLCQKFKDYELILVDDGSTDGSPAICDELKTKSQHIKVIHKPNEGQSEARNVALNKAKGEYITFVDADDTIGEDTLYLLMTLLEVHHEYDILEYPVYRFYGSPRQFLLQFHDKEYTDMDEYWLKGEAYLHSFACNKIYKHELFRGIRFTKRHIFEDIEIMPLLLKKAKIVATTDIGTYYYHLNPNSTTFKATGEQLAMLLETHIKIMRELEVRRRFSLKYYAHVLNIQLSVCAKTGQKPILAPIPSWAKSEPLADTKMKIKLTLLRLLGINALCRLYRMTAKS